MRNGKYILTVFVVLLGIFGCQENKSVEDEDMFQKGLRHFINVEYGEAYKYFGIARTLYHNEGDKELEMQALKNMAISAFWAGETDSCITRLRQGVEIAREIKNAYEEYDFYYNLYSACRIKADMKHAMQLSLKMDSMAINTKDARIRMDKFFRLAQEAAEQQNPQLQEYYLLELERLLEELPDDDRTSAQYLVYGNIRDFYANMQDYDKARKYSRLYINTSMKKENKADFDYMVYDREAILCACQHNRSAAFEALRSMKKGLESFKDVPPIHWMHYYEVKGQVHGLFQEWNEACNAYKKALTAVKGKEPSTWIEYHQIINRLGGALYQTKQYEKSRRCYELYAAFCKAQFGAESFDYAGALWTLANFEGLRNEKAEGCNHYIQSVDIAKELVSSQLRYISIQERNVFWHSLAPMMYSMPAYALKIGEKQSLFTQKCYEALIFSKALLLVSDRSMAMAINKECTKKELELYHEMVNLQNAVKSLAKDHEKNKEQIDQMHQRISSLDKQLTPVISRLGYTDFLNLNYSDIQEMLGENEILLDFTDFVSDEQVHQHVAFVVDNKQKYPKLIKSFTEEEINTLLDRKPLDFLYSTPMADKAVELLWRPFTEEVKGKQTIYYVPSGMMHQIALESLPMQDGSLLGEHYHFVRLSSAREVVRTKIISSASSQKTAILYGDLKYDMDETDMEKEASHYDVDTLFAMNTKGRTRGSGKWGELKITKEEIEAIGQLLNKKSVHVTPMTGVNGTEESFFAMSGHSPHILHIATHGFYYTQEEARDETYLNGYSDAMQLSGLILSGGNTEWTGRPIPQGVMGGVLTANDIATLDLRGTDLVVLSACQTGLGVATPEGIYGLQRAFKKAGVQTIIMSLWNIKDEVARDFMVKFYEELTGPSKWNKQEAFENAKEHIRSSYKDDPYKWAAFVMLD